MNNVSGFISIILATGAFAIANLDDQTPIPNAQIVRQTRNKWDGKLLIRWLPSREPQIYQVPERRLAKRSIVQWGGLPVGARHLVALMGRSDRGAYLVQRVPASTLPAVWRARTGCYHVGRRVGEIVHPHAVHLVKSAPAYRNAQSPRQNGDLPSTTDQS